VIEPQHDQPRIEIAGHVLAGLHAANPDTIVYGRAP
jgi:hypothetical protein